MCTLLPETITEMEEAHLKPSLDFAPGYKTVISDEPFSVYGKSSKELYLFRQHR